MVPTRSRSSRASKRSGSDRACTSARPVRPVCTTWSTRSSTTPSTRPWPVTARRIDVTLLPDGGCEVVDDGRGIPVDKMSEPGRQVGRRGRADRAARRRQVRRRRLQGVRRPPRRRRLGRQRPVEARRGRDRPRRHPPRDEVRRRRQARSSALHEAGPAPDGRTGTTVRFWPDGDGLRRDPLPGPDPHRAIPDDGVPQRRPRDPLPRSSAPTATMPSSSATTAASATSSATSTPPRKRCSPTSATSSRSRTTDGGRDRVPVEHRLQHRRHPLLRQRHHHHRRRHARGGLQEVPHQLGQQVRQGQGPPQGEGRPTSRARTSARA